MTSEITVVMATRPCEECIMFGAKKLLMTKGMRCYECLRSNTTYGCIFRLYPMFVPEQEEPQCPMCGAMCKWHIGDVREWHCPNHHLIITASAWSVLRPSLEEEANRKRAEGWARVKAFVDDKEVQARNRLRKSPS